MLPKSVSDCLGERPLRNSEIKDARKACLYAGAAFVIYAITRQVPLNVFGLQVSLPAITSVEPFLVLSVMLAIAMYVLWDLWTAGLEAYDQWMKNHWSTLWDEITKVLPVNSRSALQFVTTIEPRSDFNKEFREANKKNFRDYLEEIVKQNNGVQVLEVERWISEHRDTLRHRQRAFRHPLTPVQLSTLVVLLCLGLAFQILMHTATETAARMEEVKKTLPASAAQEIKPYVLVVDNRSQGHGMTIAFPLFGKTSSSVLLNQLAGVPEKLVESLKDCVNKDGPILQIRGFADSACFNDTCDADSKTGNVALANKRAVALADHFTGNNIENIQGQNQKTSDRRIGIRIHRWDESPTGDGFESMRTSASYTDIFEDVYREGAGQLNRRAEIVLENPGRCAPSELMHAASGIRTGSR